MSFQICIATLHVVISSCTSGLNNEIQNGKRAFKQKASFLWAVTLLADIFRAFGSVFDCRWGRIR